MRWTVEDHAGWMLPYRMTRREARALAQRMVVRFGQDWTVVKYRRV